MASSCILGVYDGSYHLSPRALLLYDSQIKKSRPRDRGLVMRNTEETDVDRKKDICVLRSLL